MTEKKKKKKGMKRPCEEKRLGALKLQGRQGFWAVDGTGKQVERLAKEDRNRAKLREITGGGDKKRGGIQRERERERARREKQRKLREFRGCKKEDIRGENEKGKGSEDPLTLTSLGSGMILIYFASPLF